MLVLSRKQDESLEIYVPGWKPIIVTVVDCNRGRNVRLGILADEKIKILRTELKDDKPQITPTT